MPSAQLRRNRMLLLMMGSGPQTLIHEPLSRDIGKKGLTLNPQAVTHLYWRLLNSCAALLTCLPARLLACPLPADLPDRLPACLPAHPPAYLPSPPACPSACPPAPLQSKYLAVQSITGTKAKNTTSTVSHHLSQAFCFGDAPCSCCMQHCALRSLSDVRCSKHA